MKTKKNGGILYNNPLHVKNDIDTLVGQRDQDINDDYCKFISPRYGWRAAFIFLFQAYEDGNETVEDLVRDVCPDYKGFDSDKIAAFVEKTSWLAHDEAMPSPYYNATFWTQLAECIALALNNIDKIVEKSEMWIGWAMAWSYYFDLNAEYKKRDI